MPYLSYRKRLAHDVWRIFGFPALALSALLQLTRTSLGWSSIPCYVSVIVAWGYVKGMYTDYTQAAEASRLGVRRIPRVCGKLPGNVDILFRMMKAFKTRYIMGVYLDLFEEYQTSVLNLRILWKDQVRC
jgi:hypothetical protein